MNPSKFSGNMKPSLPPTYSPTLALGSSSPFPNYCFSPVKVKSAYYLVDSIQGVQHPHWVSHCDNPWRLPFPPLLSTNRRREKWEIPLKLPQCWCPTSVPLLAWPATSVPMLNPNRRVLCYHLMAAETAKIHSQFSRSFTFYLLFLNHNPT